MNQHSIQAFENDPRLFTYDGDGDPIGYEPKLVVEHAPPVHEYQWPPRFGQEPQLKLSERDLHPRVACQFQFSSGQLIERKARHQIGPKHIFVQSLHHVSQI